MKIFNSLILSISLLNFSANAMENPDLDTSVSAGVIKRSDVEIVNKAVASTKSHTDFKDEMSKHGYVVHSICSGGNFHEKDWNFFKEGIAAKPLTPITAPLGIPLSGEYLSLDSVGPKGQLSVIFYQPRE